MTTTLVATGDHAQPSRPTDATELLRMFARSADRFAGVLAHDPDDQTPSVWYLAPPCENN